MNGLDFSVFATTDAWMSLLTLTFMEIVLGIDNILFVSIVVNRVPKEKQARVRNLGMLMAMGFRIIMLFGLSVIIAMTKPIFEFEAFGRHVQPSGQSLILMLGGIFLIFKAISEIHGKLEGPKAEKPNQKQLADAAAKAVIQIAVINVVFSFDSILTAAGMTKYLAVMILSVVISMAIMMIFMGRLGHFIDNHPTVQMLGLSFLILIGFMLIAEGAHKAHLVGHPEDEEIIPKSYLYFAIFFSLAVEFLNLRMRKRSEEPVQLRGATDQMVEEGLIDK